MRVLDELSQGLWSEEGRLEGEEDDPPLRGAGRRGGSGGGGGRRAEGLRDADGRMAPVRAYLARCRAPIPPPLQI